MAKKKKASAKAKAPDTAFPDDDLEPIDAGDWKGIQNWGCPYCSMTSLNKDRVREHAFRAHRA